MTNIFTDFKWHSSMEMPENIMHKRVVKSLPVTASNLNKFMRVGNNGSFLIHKSSQALWKFSSDNKTIEPVFQDEVLTEDQL